MYMTYDEATKLAKKEKGHVVTFDMGEGKVGWALWKNGRVTYGEFEKETKV